MTDDLIPRDVSQFVIENIDSVAEWRVCCF